MSPAVQSQRRVVSSATNINQIKIYSDIAHNIAGPFDTRQVNYGVEKHDSEILIHAYEAFYAGQINQPLDLCPKYEKDINYEKLSEFKEKRCYLTPKYQ